MLISEPQFLQQEGCWLFAVARISPVYSVAVKSLWVGSRQKHTIISLEPGVLRTHCKHDSIQKRRGFVSVHVTRLDCLRACGGIQLWQKQVLCVLLLVVPVRTPTRRILSIDGWNFKVIQQSDWQRWTNWFTVPLHKLGIMPEIVRIIIILGVLLRVAGEHDASTRQRRFIEPPTEGWVHTECFPFTTLLQLSSVFRWTSYFCPRDTMASLPFNDALEWFKGHTVFK